MKATENAKISARLFKAHDYVRNQICWQNWTDEECQQAEMDAALYFDVYRELRIKSFRVAEEQAYMQMCENILKDEAKRFTITLPYDAKHPALSGFFFGILLASIYEILCAVF